MKLPSSLLGRRAVVLDTMVFIYLFEDAGDWVDICEFILQQTTVGRFGGLVTPITAAELLVKPLSLGRHDVADRYRRALASLPNVAPAVVGMETGWLAGSLRAKHLLPLPDMLQVAVALQQPRPAIVTNDKAFRRVKELDVFLLDDFSR